MKRPGAMGASTAVALASLVFAVLVASAGAQGGSAMTSPGSRVDWERLMPPGGGREYVTALCDSCHSVALLALQRMSTTGWRRFLLGMSTARTAPGDWCLCSGGPLDESEIDLLAAYLGRAFGRDNPIDQLPLNVNTAAPAALERLPGLTAGDVRLLVTTRARAPFTSRAAIGQLLGAAKFRRIGDFLDVQDSMACFIGRRPL